MKKWFKIALAALLGVAVCVSGALYLLRPLAVEVSVVEPRTVSLTFTETGSYEYTRLYTVYPLLAGELLELPVREGDRVEAGDVLAVVSATDYDHQIRQLSATIAGYNGQISNLALQEQQQKDSLAADLPVLESQLAILEAELTQSRDANESLETQLAIQERLVNLNIAAVQIARDHLKDMRDYGEDYEITQAQQAVNAAQNALAQSQLLLEQLQNGTVPEEIYEAQRQAIEAQMASIDFQLEQSYTGGMSQYYTAQINAAQHSIAQLQEMSGRATLTAPVGGVIHRLATDQNLLFQGAAVAVIGDLPMVEVWVPVREIDGVAVGDGVELTLDRSSGGQTIAGQVFDLEEEARVMPSALGVEERKVRVLVRPAVDILAIGYEVDVRFTPHTYADVLVVPKTALFQDGEAHFVWLLQDDLLVLREVVPGVELRDGHIIDEGLAAGDAVVADADDAALREGRRASAG